MVRRGDCVRGEAESGSGEEVGAAYEGPYAVWGRVRGVGG